MTVPCIGPGYRLCKRIGSGSCYDTMVGGYFEEMEQGFLCHGASGYPWQAREMGSSFKQSR